MCFPLSSIAKKQIVALTGLLLIVFVIAHLAGNLFIYGGADAFNAYAAKLKSIGILLICAEYGLLLIFLVHITFTACVVYENIKARGGLTRYAVVKPVGERSIATQLMPYSGTYLLCFIIWHLFDFEFSDHHGIRSVIADKSYGLYGVAVNAFADPAHSVLYIIAMCFLGLHLSHGIESTAQTFGFNHHRFTPVIQKSSRFLALLIAIGFSSIPVYVLFFLK